MRKFKLISEQQNQAQQVQCEGVNAIEIVNTGDEIVYFDNRPIPVYAAGMQEYPSISYYGLDGENMVGTLDLRFAGGGANPAAQIIKKIYV